MAPVSLATPPAGARTASRDTAEHRAADEATALFRADVIFGLSQPQKALPPKYFYDAAGSRLFDHICRLPEYYPTRCELEILKARAAEIGALAGPGASLVEFGSGSSIKVRLLLDAMAEPAAYVPIDISGPHMRAAVARLAEAYPAVAMVPVEADFTQAVRLPPLGEGGRLEGRRVGFFPGSTIGNFTPEAATSFLAHVGKVLGDGSALVIGFDLAKDRAVLEAAYDDRAGITAAFNLNLLSRINREVGADFDPGGFRHKAFFNGTENRIEMHLESVREQAVRMGRHHFAFARGETIHTENSYKFSVDAFLAMARHAGWRQRAMWTDPKRWFAVAALERQGEVG
ncbi:UNVERIFIED_ORG: dimethylhistidine N-methyltransferase [Xanthobacter viscosus]|jgi:dimethylhistidine N-methyltransferase|uniref:L-histidine N(Alpha)-methyltransferase n=1 Tax=Xanthobacter autotrophicus TaxID=280 RepID=A0A6C1KI40_XANAU|nr:L-histidine N(alpha)-methyltransferase [Xanthobacter autotrophicus]TLX43471.1 L-histidine N(alpha)-methyltransferase [Xanthobacter autotrophicus]